MKRIGSVPMSAAFVLVTGLAACSSETAFEPIDRLPRQLTAVEQSIINNANRFGFDLMREVRESSDAPNVVLSPLSASMALGMALNGAAGETWDGMRTGLRFDGLSEGEINDGYASIIELLTGLDPRVRFDIGNSVWTDLGYPVLPSFYDAVERSFHAEARELDFASPSAVETINKWVEAATRGRIEEIINEISPGAAMFLINAIYFEGDWTEQFDPAETREAAFTRADGSTVSVPMMAQKMEVASIIDSDYTAIELSYGGGAYGMVLILPDPSVPLRSFLQNLDDVRWNDLTARLEPAELEVSIPKLELTFDAYLNDPLIALGMEHAFSGQADFSRLSANGGCIEYVRQKTFLKADEKGTVAAAVTAVAVLDRAAAEFRANRPFLFAIRERFSGTILFIGAVGDPTVDEAPTPETPESRC